MLGVVNTSSILRVIIIITYHPDDECTVSEPSGDGLYAVLKMIQQAPEEKVNHPEGDQEV